MKPAVLMLGSELVIFDTTYLMLRASKTIYGVSMLSIPQKSRVHARFAGSFPMA